MNEYGIWYVRRTGRGLPAFARRRKKSPSPSVVSTVCLVVDID
jgi:hypothetical protein